MSTKKQIYTGVVIVQLMIILFFLYHRTAVQNYIFQIRNTPLDERQPLQTTNKNEGIAKDVFENPVTHIGFLKVHKAASSTMQNILFRFGTKHNLNFVVPKTGYYFTNFSNLMPLPKGEHFDIFDVHTISYKPEIFRTLLPDAVYIAIVREPYERLVSAAYYYRDRFNVKYLRQIPRDHFIKNLINNPEKYDKQDFSMTKNAMARDFGFSNSTTKDSDIQLKLEQLNKEFQLVLVVERFEESMVLLKRLLHWSLQDILFISSNTHDHEAIAINGTEKEKVRNTLRLDYAIYNYFYKKLDDKIKQAGKDFQDEVLFYQQMLQKVTEFCVHGKKYGFERNDTLTVEDSNWNSKFNVKSQDCIEMSESVENIQYKMQKRHRGVYLNKNGTEKSYKKTP